MGAEASSHSDGCSGVSSMERSEEASVRTSARSEPLAARTRSRIVDEGAPLAAAYDDSDSDMELRAGLVVRLMKPDSTNHNKEVMLLHPLRKGYWSVQFPDGYITNKYHAGNFLMPENEEIEDQRFVDRKRLTLMHGPLCEALLVPGPAGVSLILKGGLRPEAQECQLDVFVMQDGREAILRVMISETGNDRGMLLETATGMPIAFCDTGTVVGPQPAGNERRAVAVRTDLQRRASGIYCTVEPRGMGCFVARRGSCSFGDALLTVNVDVKGSRANVVEAGGELMAVMETQSESSRCVIHLSAEVDSALVLCCLLAAAKMGLKRADNNMQTESHMSTSKADSGIETKMRTRTSFT